ncbi:hypothetical protein SJAV_09800 [Sulfurisphaera javensis]|uniref:Uncharacterized protein n=1 Tax=Sulfurisphaera javensis TaxID=2049879 RepID=A0AAT9GQ46_9CREN
MNEITVKVPKKILYEDQNVKVLPEDFSRKEGKPKIIYREIYQRFKKDGFHEVFLELRKGKKYALSINNGKFMLEFMILDSLILI